MNESTITLDEIKLLLGEKDLIIYELIKKVNRLSQELAKFTEKKNETE